MGGQNREDDRIFQIIDKVLKQVFGEEATNYIYKYLEQHYALHKNNFSERIDIFAKGLEDCLSTGATAIECKILEDISAVYGSRNDISFERYNSPRQMKTAPRSA